MRTVQMTLEEDLLREVDRLAKRLRTTRSAFTRQALRAALKRYEVRQLEARHRRGYNQQPVTKGEFDSWEDEQVWGDQ